MMLKSVGVAVIVTAFFLFSAGGGVVAQKVDISQLEGLDVPEGLKEIIGGMYAEFQAELRNKTLVEEELRGEISWLKKDREAFQNKTRVVEAELRKENAALWIKVTELQNQTKTNSARLDQCEIDTHPFIKEMERRRMQFTISRAIHQKLTGAPSCRLRLVQK
eukprot:SAG22_NODE_565_length_9046_cov_142.250475_11_plen_163_part_00